MALFNVVLTKKQGSQKTITMKKKSHRDAKVARSTKRRNFLHEAKNFPSRRKKIFFTMRRKLRRHVIFSP